MISIAYTIAPHRGHVLPKENFRLLGWRTVGGRSFSLWEAGMPKRLLNDSEPSRVRAPGTYKSSSKSLHVPTAISNILPGPFFSCCERLLGTPKRMAELSGSLWHVRSSCLFWYLSWRLSPPHVFSAQNSLRSPITIYSNRPPSSTILILVPKNCLCLLRLCKRTFAICRTDSGEDRGFFLPH